MPQNTVELVIAAKDAVTATVNNISTTFKRAFAEYDATIRRFNGHMNDTISSIAAVGGSLLGAREAFQVFRQGIEAIDSFQQVTIGVAATLTDMTESAGRDLRSIYQKNLIYAQETYRKIEAESRKHFASGKEIVEAWQILTQKGVLLASDRDIEALGTIVDKIKLVTQGQSSSLQIAQELRSMLEGEVRPQDQLSKIMATQLGPEWEKQVRLAREQGTLVQLIARQVEGLKVAMGDVEKTLTAQKTSLSTILAQIGRDGLSGAYNDIVGILASANAYLREHAEIIGAKIRSAWQNVRDIASSVVSVYEFMSEASGAHGGIGDEILKWSAAVALFSLALRSAYSILSVIIGKFIASFVWLKEVIMRIGPDLIASIAGIMAVNPVLGVIYGAIVSIGLAIAGWNILKVVGDFDVAGLKIKDWFALAGTYLNEFAVKVEKFFLTDFSTHVKNGFEKAREAAKAGWQMLLEGVDWAAEQLKNAAAPKPGGADKKPPTFEWMFGAAGLPPNITKEEKAAALDLKQEEIEKERQLLLLKQQIANSDRTILDMSKSEDVFPGYGPDEPSLGITSTLKQDLALMQKRLDEARDNAKKLYDAETAYAEASYKYRTVLRSWEQRENQTLYEQKIIDAEQFNMKHKAILEAEGHDRIEVLKTELAGIDLVAKAAVDAAKTDEDKKKAWYDSAVKKPSLTNQIIEQERELAFLQADAEKKLDAARGERLAKEKEMLLTSLESTSVTAEEKRAVEERYYAVVDELIQRQRKEMVQLGTSDVQIDRWVKGEKEKSREELIKKEDELTKKKKDKLDAEVSALKDIVNQESLTADRRKAVNEQYLQKRIEQINQEAEERKNKGMDAVTLSQWVAAKTEEAQREALKVSGSAWDGFLSKWEEARSQLSRPFDTGAKLFESLKRGIDNAADALAEFTMTGKMSFTDFANSVVKDILKIMYQSLLTKAILGESGGGGGILSWITSFFGGGGTGGPTTGDYGVETYAGIGHTGGIVGEASWPVRAMPSAVYDMAPRLHSGLAADEFPAILQRGETVIPKGGGGILSWITSFFGGGGTGGPTTGDYGVETYAGIGHTGGIVGEASWPVRAMPSAVYHMAPRLHSGLAADEFPAILQRGETVIPKGRGPAGTSTINSSITVNVNGGSGPGSWSGAGPYAGGSDPKVLGREIALVVKAEFDKHLGECIRPGGQLNRKGITA